VKKLYLKFIQKLLILISLLIKNMKILYFVHSFPPSVGAGGINAFKIAKYLGKFGHSILVLSPGVFSKSSPKSNLNGLSDLDIKVKYSSKLMKIPLNLIFSHFENLLKYIFKLYSHFTPDIILSQYQGYHYASVVGGYTSKILKLPHIIRSHDILFPTSTLSLPLQIMHSISYPLIYKSILNCDIFYVTTTEMKRHLLKFKKLQKVNFKLHPNGIDTKEFFPSNNQDDLKNEYGCDKILLFHGQISKEYGLQDLVNIFPEILKTHKDTHLIIIGGGPYLNNIKDIVRRNNMEKQVHILGVKPHEEMPYYINNSDIGIGLIAYKDTLINRYSIPVKCLEFMACKKPFISAPLSHDLIKNNDVGIMLKKNFTRKDLIENLISLLEDKNLRRKLGENGFKKIYQKFRWEDLMSKFNNDMQQVIENYQYPKQC